MALTKIESNGLLLSDNFDFTGNVTGAGETNEPSFYGRLASDQSVSRATTTKITGMTGNEVDTATAFDGTTFTVPSGKGGKYYIEAVVTGDYSNAGQDGEETVAMIYKNGSAIKLATYRENSSVTGNTRVCTTVATAIVDLSATDTIEMFAHIQDATGSGNHVVKGELTSLQGFRIAS